MIRGTRRYCKLKVEKVNRRNEKQLQVFERRILWKIFGPIRDNGKWRIRYNSELYSIYTGPDIIKTIKISKLRWTI